MMNMMTGAVAINGGVGVMEVRQSIAKNVAQAAEQMAADLAVNAHITLRELKTKIDTVVEKKLPTFKGAGSSGADNGKWSKADCL